MDAMPPINETDMFTLNYVKVPAAILYFAQADVEDWAFCLPVQQFVYECIVFGDKPPENEEQVDETSKEWHGLIIQLKGNDKTLILPFDEMINPKMDLVVNVIEELVSTATYQYEALDAVSEETDLYSKITMDLLQLKVANGLSHEDLRSRFNAVLYNMYTDDELSDLLPREKLHEILRDYQEPHYGKRVAEAVSDCIEQGTLAFPPTQEEVAPPVTIGLGLPEEIFQQDTGNKKSGRPHEYFQTMEWIILNKVFNKTYEYIAHEYNFTPDAVRKRCSRLIRLLKSTLDE